MHKIQLFLANQLFYPVQLLFVIGILSILALIAIHEYEVPKIKAYSTEALGVATVMKQEVVLFHSLTGRWPDAESIRYVFVGTDGTTYYPGTEVINGSFKIPFDTHNKRFGVQTLAFNRVELPGAPSATVWWDCGLPRSTDNYVIHREFKTTLEKRYLLSVCKP